MRSACKGPQGLIDKTTRSSRGRAVSVLEPARTRQPSLQPAQPAVHPAPAAPAAWLQPNGKMDGNTERWVGWEQGLASGFSMALYVWKRAGLASGSSMALFV